jgi:hypothetical protein
MVFVDKVVFLRSLVVLVFVCCERSGYGGTTISLNKSFIVLRNSTGRSVKFQLLFVLLVGLALLHEVERCASRSINASFSHRVLQVVPGWARD